MQAGAAQHRLGRAHEVHIGMLLFHSEGILSNAALIAFGKVGCNVDVDDACQKGKCSLWTCSAVSLNAGYGHTVGTLQGLSLIPVAIGRCTLCQGPCMLFQDP